MKESTGHKEPSGWMAGKNTEKLAELLGVLVVIRLRPYCSSKKVAADLCGHLVALDPVTGSCMLLVQHPASKGSTPIDAEATVSATSPADNADSSEDGEISEHTPELPTHRITIVSGHSIDRIEPDIYSDDFNLVYSNDELNLIADQLHEPHGPSYMLSLEEARRALVVRLEEHKIPVTLDTDSQHTLRLYNGIVYKM
ncbi:hypothetical protein BASA62_002958 [Batrachochytrium salamandrivorans]|nr:hypothetical protein BASA62_002958 [Batrachochytrium salamandrivorans]